MKTRRELTVAEVAYIAGLFDGEGCISIMKRVKRWPTGEGFDYALHLRLANTNFEVVHWLADLVGGAVYDHTNKKNRGNRRPSRIWHLAGKEARVFVELIRPYVIVKRRQIDLAFKFWDLSNSPVPHLRARLHAEMMGLNLRGRDGDNGEKPEPGSVA